MKQLVMNLIVGSVIVSFGIVSYTEIHTCRCISHWLEINICGSLGLRVTNHLLRLLSMEHRQGNTPILVKEKAPPTAI